MKKNLVVHLFIFVFAYWMERDARISIVKSVMRQKKQVLFRIKN